MFIDAILLGLASGSYCVMFCAPVLVPWFFSKQIPTAGRNALYLSLYLAGRLSGYILIGVIAGVLGSYAAGYLSAPVDRAIGGATQTLAGALLIFSGVYSLKGRCRAAGRFADSAGGAASLGFLSGMKMCPPLFAAAMRVFSGDLGPLGGGAFFTLFFIASSLYFTPLLFVFKLNKAPEYFRSGARVLCIMMGVYYIAFLGLPALFQSVPALR